MKYDFEPVDVNEHTSLSLIVRRIKPNSQVLEFGPANGRMTRYLKESLGCRVTIIEQDAEAAKDAAGYAQKAIIANAEELSWCNDLEHDRFDYIVFADVLEHLRSPEKLILAAKRFLNSDGSILVSIPNASHNAVVMGLMDDRFDYTPTGLLDDTHLRFFTKTTFDQFVEEVGLHTSYVDATLAHPADTEQNRGYDRLESDVADYLRGLPHGEVYQYVYELSQYPCPVPDNRLEKASGLGATFAQLFFADGDQICEDRSLKLAVGNLFEGQELAFEMELNEDLPLRLDPFNRPCELKIQQVEYHCGDQVIDLVRGLSTNACEREDQIFLFGNDPQIYLPLDGFSHPPERLVFRAQLRKLGRQAYVALEQALKLQIEEKSRQVEDLERLVAEQNQTIHQLGLLAQSMRLKSRASRLLKRVVGTRLHNLLRFAYLNRNFPYLIVLVLREAGVKGLLRRLKRISQRPSLEVMQTSGGYCYREPVLPPLKSELRKTIDAICESGPLISVVMPVFNVDPEWLDRAINSLRRQWYPYWELCIADDKSTNRETLDYLRAIDDPRISVRFLSENKNISGATNAALALAKGEFVALMDNDDELTVDALYEVARVISQSAPDFIYSDEDKIEADGSFSTPHFKPDFSPDMFLCQNYLSHLGVVRKSLIDAVGGFTVGLEGAQDYDLYLRVAEHTDKIHHIPKVLYHWRKVEGSTAVDFDAKSYAQDAGVRAVAAAIERRGLAATARPTVFPGIYRVNYELVGEPLVSIVVPFKDRADLLRLCVESVEKHSTYANFELIGISNNSEEPETFAEMERLAARYPRVRFYEYNHPFNYSRINNYAVANYATGEHLVLLNNDIEIISPNWLEELLMHSQRPEIGCVGAMLYYPNNRVQHAGVIVGLGGVACHSHKEFKRDDPGYFRRLQCVQNLSAVTAACLMVKRSIFDELQGLNEDQLKVAFNDVDFCLRAREAGYLNLFTPHCEAYHHESISRGAEDSPDKLARFQREIDYMKTRHAQILANGDPYYNPNLTLNREDFSLGAEHFG